MSNVMDTLLPDSLLPHVVPLLEHIRASGISSLQICAAGCVHVNLDDDMHIDQRLNLGDKLARDMATLSRHDAREMMMRMLKELPDDAGQMIDRRRRLAQSAEITGENCDDLDPLAAKFGETIKAAGMTLEEIQQLRKQHASGR